MKRIFRESTKNNLPYLIIMFLSILPFWKTGITGLMERTDSDFPLMPVNNFYSQLFVWYDKVTMGFDVSSAFLSQIPFYALLALFTKLGVPLPILQKFWFILGLFLAGLFSYLLNLYLTKKKLPSLLGSFIYVFNPVTLHLLSQGQHVLIFCYAFAPAFLLFSIKAVDTKKYRYALYIALLSILAAITSVPSLIIIFMPAFLFLFYSLATRENKIFVLKFIFVLLLGLLIFHSWWFLPGILSLSRSSQIEDINRMWLFNWKTISESASYFDALIGAGIPKPVIGSKLALAVLYVVFVIGALLMLLKKSFKKQHILQYLLLLFVFSFLFAIGDKGIWGDFQQFAMSKVSYLQMFRNPHKFAQITMLCYSALGAIFLATAIDRLRNIKLKAFFVAIFMLIFLAGNSPILSGNLQGFLKPIHIPEEYYEVNKMIGDNVGDGGIFILPQEEWLTKYKWAPYDMPDFSRYIFDAPIIRDYPENRLANLEAVYLMTTAYDIINHGVNTELSHYLYFMNARYVLLHKDIEPYTRQVVPYDQLRMSLSRQPDIKLIESNTYFDLYENSLFSNKIYSSTNLISDNLKIDPNEPNNILDLEKTLNQADFFEKPVFNLDRENQSLPEVSRINEAPTISFKKVSPVSYKVDVENATSDYILTFLESFSSGWEASINGKPLQDNYHFKANGYANGWFVNERGNYEVTIYYRPQRIFTYLFSLFLLTLGTSLIYLVAISIYEKNQAS